MSVISRMDEVNDYCQGFYHVYVEYARGHKPAVVDLEKLASILPHGFGIDGNWYLKVRRNGDVQVNGKYHAMDENGYYCGWHNFRFSLVRATKNKYHALSGPCEGQYQITKVKGLVYLESFVGDGDASDYLYDCVWMSLYDKMGIQAISSYTAHNEVQAKTFSRLEAAVEP